MWPNTYGSSAPCCAPPVRLNGLTRENSYMYTVETFDTARAVSVVAVTMRKSPNMRIIAGAASASVAAGYFLRISSTNSAGTGRADKIPIARDCSSGVSGKKQTLVRVVANEQRHIRPLLRAHQNIGIVGHNVAVDDWVIVHADGHRRRRGQTLEHLLRTHRTECRDVLNE